MRQYSTSEKVGGEDPSNKLLKILTPTLSLKPSEIFCSAVFNRSLSPLASEDAFAWLPTTKTQQDHTLYICLNSKTQSSINCSTDVHANTAHGNSLKAFKCSLWSTPHKRGYEFCVFTAHTYQACTDERINGIFHWMNTWSK